MVDFYSCYSDEKRNVDFSYGTCCRKGNNVCEGEVNHSSFQKSQLSVTKCIMYTFIYSVLIINPIYIQLI